MSRQFDSAGALAAAPPLIETKLLPPRGRAELVARPRLLRRLDGLSSAALTLVDAPVGVGKTVLAQSWCARSEGAVAWVSIDPADDDPVRFWTYVATAVDRVRSGLGRGALRHLRSPGVAATESAVIELMNGIAAFGEPLALVLDDLHALKSRACLDLFELAVEHLPPNARIVTTTRSDPAIALGRLRAQGSLGEIRAGDLAFTVDEARELLRDQEHIDIDDDDVAMLVERTEGWPAGLYLAALWLRTLPDPRAHVRHFHGDHRHVADYLSGEVLDTLDVETRDFLVRTSVLGRFSASLCDSVLEREGSARIIADLRRSNLFVIALDQQGQWYRYHHLFAELLQLDLSTRDGSASGEVHRRASEWYLDHDLLEDALEHAYAAGDDARVAVLLAQHHNDFLRKGRQATLLHWVELLPNERLLDHAILAPAAALAAGLLGREAGERRRFVGLARRARAERPEEWTPYHEVALGLAQTTWVDSDLRDAVAEGRRMVEVAREDDEITVPALASLAFLVFLSGDVSEARAIAQEAVDRPEAEARPHGLVYALATLSLVAAEIGDSREAESIARKAVSAAVKAEVAQSGSGGAARVALARALAVAGRLPEAEKEAVAGERLRHQPDPEMGHVHALLVLAEIRAKRGQVARARDELAQAQRALETFVDAGTLGAQAARVARTIDGMHTAAGALEELPSMAELQVLRLLAGHLSQREIGSKLFLSVNTVKTHTRTLYRKLGATSRDGAVVRATALGLLDEDDSPG